MMAPGMEQEQEQEQERRSVLANRSHLVSAEGVRAW